MTIKSQLRTIFALALGVAAPLVIEPAKADSSIQPKLSGVVCTPGGGSTVTSFCNPSAARTALQAAQSGTNNDIVALLALNQPIPIAALGNVTPTGALNFTPLHRFNIRDPLWGTAVCNGDPTYATADTAAYNTLVDYINANNVQYSSIGIDGQCEANATLHTITTPWVGVDGLTYNSSKIVATADGINLITFQAAGWAPIGSGTALAAAEVSNLQLVHPNGAASSGTALTVYQTTNLMINNVVTTGFYHGWDFYGSLGGFADNFVISAGGSYGTFEPGSALLTFYPGAPSNDSGTFFMENYKVQGSNNGPIRYLDNAIDIQAGDGLFFGKGHYGWARTCNFKIDPQFSYAAIHNISVWGSNDGGDASSTFGTLNDVCISQLPPSTPPTTLVPNPPTITVPVDGIIFASGSGIIDCGGNGVNIDNPNALIQIYSQVKGCGGWGIMSSQVANLKADYTSTNVGWMEQGNASNANRTPTGFARPAATLNAGTPGTVTLTNLNPSGYEPIQLSGVGSSGLTDQQNYFVVANSVSCNHANPNICTVQIASQATGTQTPLAIANTVTGVSVTLGPFGTIALGAANGTATVTAANPATISWSTNNTNLFPTPNQEVTFQTTGTIPTGLTAGPTNGTWGQIYYIVPGTINCDGAPTCSAQIATTQFATQGIALTDTGSGTLTIYFGSVGVMGQAKIVVSQQHTYGVGIQSPTQISGSSIALDYLWDNWNGTVSNSVPGHTSSPKMSSINGYARNPTCTADGEGSNCTATDSHAMGNGAKAQGLGNYAWCDQCTASGEWSFVLGGFWNNDDNREQATIIGGNNNQTQPSIFRGLITTLQVTVAGGSTEQMTVDGASSRPLTGSSAGAGGNCINLPLTGVSAGGYYTYRLESIDVQAAGNSYGEKGWIHTNVGATAATFQTHSGKDTSDAFGNGATAVLAFAPDTTNACVTINYTAPTGNAHTWKGTLLIYGPEVASGG